MKKILIAAIGALATSSVLAAGTTVCAAPTAAQTGTTIDGALGYTGTSGGAGFVLNSFAPKCSAKSYVAVEQNSTAIAVASGSSGGSKIFSGSTNGGSVVPSGTCAATGCTEDNAKGATAAALAAST